MKAQWIIIPSGNCQTQAKIDFTDGNAKNEARSSLSGMFSMIASRVARAFFVKANKYLELD
ncbi:hypothetical protein [Candidatus Leptofilum sp.]|uniref:hypothetical protein n=1 Tax=Candidatus Leptofilum sp. TaxID=3241576 RepID=UPI003B5BB03C